MMTEEASDKARRAWARVTGLMLLLTNGTAIYATWVRATFIALDDPARTAANVAADQSFVRIGLAFDLITTAGTVALVAGLYLVLKRVGPGLALLAFCWRLIENSVLAALTFASFAAVTLVEGGTFLRALNPAEASDLAYALFKVQIWGFQFGFLFLGLGQAAFSYLWWKSRYIPRWLAGLGMVASSIMAVAALGIIAWPRLYTLLGMAYMAPMGLYEIGLGFWLLIRGIRLEPVGQPQPS
jgi:hypothetical protein